MENTTKIIVRCLTSKGGAVHVQADYNGKELSNFYFSSSNKKVDTSKIKVSFCPLTQYLEGEYNFDTNSITEVQVYRKRTQEERLCSMLAIALQTQKVFR